MANTVTVNEQLAAHGYCIIDESNACDLLQDTSDVLSGWFEHASQQQKRDAAASTTDIAAGTGRGYFCVPAKEVFEVTRAWAGLGAGADLKLAAKTAFSTLQQLARDTADTVFCRTNGFKVSQQQLKQLLGQPQSGRSQTHNGSFLHINKCRSTSLTATIPQQSGRLGLQGCEAHVDRGLLTLIYATGPGLQVFSRDGSWIPVTPGPGQLVVLVGHTLSFITAGRLPAALHRVVTPAGADSNNNITNSSSSRLSLCFKLHADPAVLLSPAKVTGTKADRLPTRYSTPKTTRQLLEEFDATHISIHSINDIAEASIGNSGRGQAHKRQRTEPTPEVVSCAADGPAEPGLLQIICRNMIGEDMAFKLKPETKLGKLMEAYSADYVAEGHRLIFDGRRLEPDLTPMHYRMEDGDIIDVFKEQLGD